MNLKKLKTIEKTYFTFQDISRSLNISPESAKVTAARYIKAGYLIRIKKGIYVFPEQWDSFNNEKKFEIAGLLQTPSYISLTTALSYYEISTQIQQEYFESIAIKRTKTVYIKDSVFTYSRIKPELYFGFKKNRFFFIAEAEKAFLDALYLMSFGRYHLDLSSIYNEKLDPDKLNNFLERFPLSIQKRLKQYEFI